MILLNKKVHDHASVFQSTCVLKCGGAMVVNVHDVRAEKISNMIISFLSLKVGVIQREILSFSARNVIEVRVLILARMPKSKYFQI